MISVICGTNRKDSVSKRIANVYRDILVARCVEVHVLRLEDLPDDFMASDLYEIEGTSEVFNAFRDVMKSTRKMVFIVPEYNGSFPGVLKGFIDGLAYPDTFADKRGALVGVSSGGQGAGLALSHLTDIFNYCGMDVLAQKPRLSHIEANLTEEGLSRPYMNLLVGQAERLIGS